MAEIENFQGTQEEFRELLAQMTKDYYARTGATVALMAVEFADCSLEDMTAETRRLITPDLLNANKVLFGGLVAAFFDSSMGMLVRGYSGCKVTPTVSLTVNYEHSVLEGEVLHFKSKIDRIGKTVSYVHCRAWVEGKEDTTCYTANGIYFMKRDGIFIKK